MSSFSNSDYLRALTPQASSPSKRNIMITGLVVGAGFALLSLSLWIHYRRQIEMLKEHNEALLTKLEAAQLSAALPENDITSDEADPESDN
jgi:hypothetical protein